MLPKKFTSLPRVGVIIDCPQCPQNDIFHDPLGVIITSRMAIRKVVDHDHDHEWPLLVRELGIITTDS